MRPCLTLLALCLLPGPAAAGPWPREAGQIYVLTSHQGGGDGWSGLYAEYGGPRNLTFGLDLGGHVVGLAELRRVGFTDRDVDGRVRAFVRVPVPLPGGQDDSWRAPWLAAIELSIGRDFEEDGETIDRFGVGMSVGRGFSTRFGDGWTTVDLATSFASEGDTRSSFGLVVGLKPRERLAVEFAIFGEYEDVIDFGIGPTVQYDFGKLGQGRVGAAYRSDGDAALTVGWSRSF